MSRVNESHDTSAIRSSWERIFSTNNPFGWPFCAKFDFCRIFYPTQGYHLSRNQYSVVIDVLDAIGENRFLISIVESDGLSFLDRNWGHWLCTRPSFEEYLDIPLTLENALYSESGRWGVLISHEDHALIGGDESFMRALGERYVRWADDLWKLRDAWSNNPNAEWLESLIDRTRP